MYIQVDFFPQIKRFICSVSYLLADFHLSLVFCVFSIYLLTFDGYLILTIVGHPNENVDKILNSRRTNVKIRILAQNLF